MKLTIQSEKLSKLFDYAFLDKNFADQLFRFSKTGLLINDVTTVQGLAVIGIFMPNFFSNYDVKESENITVTLSFKDQLKTGFKSADITLQNDNTKLYMTAGKEKYKEDLTGIADDETDKGYIRSKKLGEFKTTDFGLMFKKEANTLFQGRVKKSDITIPGSENFYLISDGTNLKIEIRGIGEYSKEIIPEQTLIPVTSGFEIKMDTKYFNDLSKQFSGNCFMTIAENQNVHSVMFTEKTAEYAVFFLQSESN